MRFSLGKGSPRGRRPLWLLLAGAVLVFLPTFLLLRHREPRSGASSPSDPAALTVQTARDRGLPCYGKELSAGITLYAAGDLAGARRWFESALSDPTQKEAVPENLYYLGRTLFDSGERAAGEARLIELIEKHAASPYAGDAYGFQAERARKEGDRRKLLEISQKIAAQHKNSQAAVKALQDLARMAAERKDALEELRACSSLLGCPLDPAERERVRARAEALSRQVVFGTGAAPGVTSHEVQRGDTLDKLSRRYKTSVGFLRMTNNKQNNVVYIGEKLRVLTGEFGLLVTKRLHRVTLFFNGLYLREYPVGLGMDGKTPVGAFTIETKLTNPVWYWNGKRIPYGDPRNLLGTRWLGFSNRPGASGFGIHGTSDPTSIGKNQSAGCVRMTNADVESLFELVPKGAKVEIIE